MSLPPYFLPPPKACEFPTSAMSPNTWRIFGTPTAENEYLGFKSMGDLKSEPLYLACTNGFPNEQQSLSSLVVHPHPPRHGEGIMTSKNVQQASIDEQQLL